MPIFGKKKKATRSRKNTGTAEERQERVERNEAWKILWKQMKDDPALQRAFVLKRMGITPTEVDAVEKQKREIKAAIYSEATKMIESDEELRKQYAGNLVKNLIGHPPKHRTR
jgi:hypothetical protein